MSVYPSMSYWDCYKLSVPYRKWLIRRYNKTQEEIEKQELERNKPPQNISNKPPPPEAQKQFQEQTRRYQEGLEHLQAPIRNS